MTGGNFWLPKKSTTTHGLGGVQGGKERGGGGNGPTDKNKGLKKNQQSQLRPKERGGGGGTIRSKDWQCGLVFWWQTEGDQ